MFHSWLATEHNEVIAYSDFKRLAHDGKVMSAEISERTITVDVDLTGIQLSTTTPNGIEHTYRGPGHRTFATFRVSDPTMIPTLQASPSRICASDASGNQYCICAAECKRIGHHGLNPHCRPGFIGYIIEVT